MGSPWCTGAGTAWCTGMGAARRTGTGIGAGTAWRAGTARWAGTAGRAGTARTAGTPGRAGMARTAGTAAVCTPLGLVLGPTETGALFVTRAESVPGVEKGPAASADPAPNPSTPITPPMIQVVRLIMRLSSWSGRGPRRGLVDSSTLLDGGESTRSLR